MSPLSRSCIAGSMLALAALLSSSHVSAQVIQSDGYFSPKIPLCFNGGAINMGSGLQLTKGEIGQTTSIFTKQMVNVWAFHTTFSFQLAKGSQGDVNRIADGITFCLQNTSPTTVGSGGSNLGYSTDNNDNTTNYVAFPRSVAVKFDPVHLETEDLDSNSETGLYTDGTVPFNGIDMLSDGGVDMTSQDTFQVTLTYSEASKRLDEVVIDAQTGASFAHEYDIDIARTLGAAKAYVGFTGATGANAAVQTISAWTFNTDHFQNGSALGEPGAPPASAANKSDLLPALTSLLSGYAKFAATTPTELSALLNPSGADDAKLVQQSRLALYYAGTDTLSSGSNVSGYLQEHIVTNRQHVLLRLSTRAAGAAAPDHYLVVLSRRPDGDWNVFDPAWTRDVVAPLGAADTLNGHLRGFSAAGKSYAFTPTAAFLFAPSN